MQHKKIDCYLPKLTIYFYRCYATRYRKLTADIASDITTEIFFKELFSDLTEKEKKIVSDYFIMGKQVKKTA